MSIKKSKRTKKAVTASKTTKKGLGPKQRKELSAKANANDSFCRGLDSMLKTLSF